MFTFSVDGKYIKKNVHYFQSALTETDIDNDDNKIESRDNLKMPPDDDLIGKDYEAAPKDWMDLFIGSNTNIFPTSSAALMAQATFSDKTPEEQLAEIKKLACEITEAIQSEMANLLTYAISITDKEDCTDNKLRKKRSLESPVDSTKLVMRLLNHIKCNNEYQNIAIEKMMTAQEIADKYGIEFNPDPEMLSDLAVAANEQAKEMSEILKDACDLKNGTQNETGLVNATKKLLECAETEAIKQNTTNFEASNNMVHNHVLYVEPEYNSNSDFAKYNYYYNYPYETQIDTPAVHQHYPVSPRPSFYDYISMNPTQEYYPYCSVEPTTVIYPIEEPVVSPDVVGEEYEETVSSKVYVDHEEPGVSTVNHVMSYTLTEKTHLRSPHVDNLPQQMQYYFLLM